MTNDLFYSLACMLEVYWKTGGGYNINNLSYYRYNLYSRMLITAVGFELQYR